jgi:beta-glucanase (GH16 family)
MKYQLVWAEHFEYEGFPDPKYWSYESGYVRNNELQFYTVNELKNCRIENNQLILEVRKEKVENFNYTSASITTKGNREFLFGKIVVRAKLPSGRGIWPAIWTLGTNIDDVKWPHCGEIDIMENVGFDPLKVHGNIHTGAFNHNLETNKGEFIESDSLNNEFHDFAIVWTEDNIDFLFDDTCYFTFNKESGFGKDEWPFDSPQYLLINLAVGGFWGGKKGVDNSIFPQQFIIDSVKYYQRIT